MYFSSYSNESGLCTRKMDASCAPTKSTAFRSANRSASSRPSLPRLDPTGTIAGCAVGWDFQPGAAAAYRGGSFAWLVVLGKSAIAHARQQGQARALRGIDTRGFHAPLLEERKLTTQDQVLACYGSPRSDRERDQRGHLGPQSKEDAK